MTQGHYRFAASFIQLATATLSLLFVHANLFRQPLPIMYTAYSNGLPAELTSDVNKSDACTITTHERRSANYQPNLWRNDVVESLTTEYSETKLIGRAEKMKKDFISNFFNQATVFSKPQFIDCINKLGLSNLFEKEIKDFVCEVSKMQEITSALEGDVQASALYFRILRQEGHDVSHDIFIKFIDDEMGARKKGSESVTNCEVVLELFQASYLASDECQNLIDRDLQDIINYKMNEKYFSNQETAMTLDLPLHWRVQWFDVRQHIDAYARENGRNETLLELSKVNFNVVQAIHQRDLRELSMWWRDLGLKEKVSFARDRIVESFLWSTGVAFEPQYSSFRKWLTKVLVFVLVIDDIYDVYGSLEELECFTRAVYRWDCQEVEQLPECMKISFQALFDTMNEIASEIENEKGLVGTLTFIRNGWADFCEALLVEARWYAAKSRSPSLEEYLTSAWISSCGPLLSVIAILSAAPRPTEILKDALCKENKGIVYHSSLIIRLSNDIGSHEAERERGDCPSSILCCMREFNISEDAARGHMQDIIVESWKRINGEFIRQYPVLQASAKLIRNMARVSQFIYNKGADQYSAPTHLTKDTIKELYIEPCQLA